MEYNTSRGLLLMREYGRIVQKMVQHTLTLENRPDRQRNAEAIIEMMGFLNPQIKTMEDYRHKLWDHLFVMSDFKLDVDSPYPIPDRATYKSKPKPLEYPGGNPRYNHLGKHIELVIDKALTEKDAEKKSGFAHAIAYYMKLAYSTWHKELVHDDAIRQELNAITKGELEFTNTPFVRHRPVAFMEEESYATPKRIKFKQNNNRNNNNRGGNGGGNPNGNLNIRGGGGGNNNGNRINPNNGNGGGNRHKFGKKKFL